MPGLKRELSLASATLLGVAIIVGAGIYALIGKAAGISGDAVWLSFLVSAIVAAFTGLSYAELSSMYSKAGSSYTYIRQAFKNDLLAFLAGWLIVFELVFGASAVSLALAGYAASIINFNGLAIAAAAIIVFSAINLAGIRESKYSNNAMAVIEVGGLVFVIILGFLFGARAPALTAFDFGAVAQAAGLVFFAYLGFEAIAVESEETRLPRKTIPRAILLALGLCAVLYVLTAVAALRLLPPDALASSPAPLRDAVVGVIGEGNATWLALVAVISAASTILACLVTSSRLLYGIAEQHSLPRFVAEVNNRFRTPHYAVLLAGAASLAFLAFGGIEEIASVTNLGALIAFIMVNASVIKLRLAEPRAKREFKIPLSVKNIPVTAVLGVIASAWLALQFSAKTVAAAAAILAVGVAVYWLAKRAK
ncbi:MAG: APC family permease [Candidatus Micrarchaeota archaeon]|nr:APC family permease [Candidatus Micrarchaeota archaeon]